MIDLCILYNFRQSKLHVLNTPQATSVNFHLNKALEYLVLYGNKAVPVGLHTSAGNHLHDIYREFITSALGFCPPLPNGQTLKQQYEVMHQNYIAMPEKERENAMPPPSVYFAKKQ